MTARNPSVLLLVLAAPPAAAVAQGIPAYEREPIDYSAATEHDPVARLRRRIESGETELRSGSRRELLASLLAALDIPQSSQTLVFSKTSFQHTRITPDNPRAVYFGDDAYVGSVPGAPLLEITSMDPQQGAIFYTLDRGDDGRPELVRRNSECLGCHALGWTEGWPGNLVRSVFPDAEGHPITRLGTTVITHESPLAQRWGGWYVTGTHGRQRHMGNAFVPPERHEVDDPVRALDREAGANVTDLSARLDTDRYLTPHSDIVALMVLEHQTAMHNVLARASYRARIALAQQRASEHTTEDSTRRRLRAEANEVLEYLLWKGEAELADPIRGTSSFAQEFAARGPRDRRGRSLRDFDLESRLFRYPCSYLIYSPSFDQLPREVLSIVYLRLHRILTGRFGRRAYRHLSAADRRAILEILRDTKPGLPAYFAESR